jgi:DNA topoisomerase I
VTLLKSDVTITADRISFHFAFAERGQARCAQCPFRRSCSRAKTPQKAAGKRLFQYRAADGSLRLARRRDADAFLHKIASANVSLKDFRTLTTCACALETLAVLDPKPSEAGKQRQLRECLNVVSEELANTPAVCRKSYVHSIVIRAFEDGLLRTLA